MARDRFKNCTRATMRFDRYIAGIAASPIKSLNGSRRVITLNVGKTAPRSGRKRQPRLDRPIEVVVDRPDSPRVRRIGGGDTTQKFFSSHEEYVFPTEYLRSRSDACQRRRSLDECEKNDIAGVEQRVALVRLIATLRRLGDSRNEATGDFCNKIGHERTSGR
jgi:hypothetical protein